MMKLTTTQAAELLEACADLDLEIKVDREANVFAFKAMPKDALAWLGALHRVWFRSTVELLQDHIEDKGREGNLIVFQINDLVWP